MNTETSKVATATDALPHPPHTQTEEALAQAASGVSLRSVTKKYGPVTAVENITLDIPAGHYCCLLGPSGCGKTTVLRMIAGHEDITSGDILIGDRRVNNIPAAKRNTSMMFQSYALFPHKTVWENVEFGLRMQGVPEQERRARVGEILEIVGLSHLAKRKPNMLSGGQQQRIALSRALVTRPQVLMLDEPLSALDENLRVRMRGELRNIQKQFGMTFIQVTHHAEEAFSLSDQVVVMNHGHIDQVATPTEVFNAPASRFVAKFMGDNNIFTGRVVRCEPGADGIGLVELDVENIGAIFCRGQAVSPGTEAACSIRPDLLQMKPYADPLEASSPQKNSLTARITAIEMTGYVTRVSLMEEHTAKEILYKVRTTDWDATHFHEGQLVVLQWSPKDCVFLPH